MCVIYAHTDLHYAVRDTYEYSGTHREYSKLHLHVDAVKVLNSNSAKVIFWLGRDNCCRTRKKLIKQKEACIIAKEKTQRFKGETKRKKETKMLGVLTQQRLREGERKF